MRGDFDAPSPEQIEVALGPPRVRRRLQELSKAPLNFDRRTLAGPLPPQGFKLDDVCHRLRAEAPGPPEADGVFATAQKLIRGYEFADPSIVRAYYDPRHALLGRTMVLRLRALGAFQVLVGVRVLEVIDERRMVDGHEAQVWGWRYGTLRGHLEMGEMSWEVWKWLATGQIDFRVHALSREAHIPNPIIRIGFRVVGPHERQVFLKSTGERMQRFTDIAATDGERAALTDAASELTARPMRDDEPHEQLARNLDQRGEPK